MVKKETVSGEEEGHILSGLKSPKLGIRHSWIKQEAGQPHRSALKSAV